MLSLFAPFGRGLRSFDGLGVFDWPAFDGAATLRFHELGLPQCDVLEDGDTLTIHCEVPGMKPEDLQVGYEDGVVTVRGRRTGGYGGGRLRHAERLHGEWVRSFRIGRAYDPESAQAKLADGVLTLQLAKRAEAKAKAIPITLGEGAAAPQIEGKKS